MNILVDIGHPAQVHLFKHFVRETEKRGHSVTVYAREKDHTLRLLAAEGIRVWGFTRARGTLAWNMLELLVRDLDIWRLVRRRRIDVALGTSVPISHASLAGRVKSFVFNEDDIDVVPLLGRLAYPFCTAIVAPRCVRMGRWGYKHVPYDGYQKLAYLHPNWFTPDAGVVRRAGIDPDKPYFIVRLTAFNAYHDDDHCGLHAEQVNTLISRLLPHGRVLLNSENGLPPAWEPYRLALPPEEIHHAMAFARLFIGDGQSMTTESALLGVPALRCNTFAGRCSVIEELETRYKLVYSYAPDRFGELLERLNALLGSPDVRSEWAGKRARLLAEKTDVTRWMIDFVENAVPCVA